MDGVDEVIEVKGVQLREEAVDGGGPFGDAVGAEPEAEAFTELRRRVDFICLALEKALETCEGGLVIGTARREGGNLGAEAAKVGRDTLAREKAGNLRGVVVEPPRELDVADVQDAKKRADVSKEDVHGNHDFPAEALGEAGEDFPGGEGGGRFFRKLGNPLRELLQLRTAQFRHEPPRAVVAQRPDADSSHLRQFLKRKTYCGCIFSEYLGKCHLSRLSLFAFPLPAGTLYMYNFTTLSVFYNDKC